MSKVQGHGAAQYLVALTEDEQQKINRMAVQESIPEDAAMLGVIDEGFVALDELLKPRET